MKINTIDLRYHSSSHRNSVPGHLQLIKGKVGESCDQTCTIGKHRHQNLVSESIRMKGLTCGSTGDFLSINNCRYMRRYFSRCRGGCFMLQTLVAYKENLIGGVPKSSFSLMSPSSINDKSGNSFCWHRQSHSKHIIVSHFDQPSNCAASHPKVARLCPCVDVTLMSKKK